MGLTKSHWTIEKYHTKLLRYIPSHFISQIVDVFPPSYPIVYPYVGFLQGVIIPNHLFDLRISMKYTQPMETPICICIPSIPLPLFPQAAPQCRWSPWVALGAAVFAGVIPSRSARSAIEIIMAGWRFGARKF